MKKLEKIISHRGNLDGKSEFENTINQIVKAINHGFDVEIDLWYVEGKLYLGHDNPEHECTLEFLNDNSEKLWIHAKNLEACEYFLNQKKLNWFWHENDKLTITSKGYPWCNFGIFVKGGITVCVDYDDIPNYILGVCTDNPIQLLNHGTRSS